MTGALAATEQGKKIDSVWGDPSKWEANGRQWGSLPAIRRMINRHVTGNEDVSPVDWFFRRVSSEQALPLERGLILACGYAGLELELIRAGYVRNMVALDISPGALDAARAEAQRQGITQVDYQLDDMNALAIVGTFDFVIASSGIHHCENLESAFSVIRRVLKPGGWIFFDDYIGPNRLQYTDEQVRQINGLLQILPDSFVLNTAGMSRRGFIPASVEEVVALDPSEAPRSEELLSALGQSFQIEILRPYGGNLLYLVLANLAQNFDMAQTGDESSEFYLRLLIEASDHLRETGRCRDDFAVAIARHAMI